MNLSCRTSEFFYTVFAVIQLQNTSSLYTLVPIQSAFVPMHYLLNQPMEFDQTYIVTLMGGGES